MDLNVIKLKYPELEIGRAENLSNQQFGNWTVLYRTKNSNTNKVRWVCKCSCS